MYLGKKKNKKVWWLPEYYFNPPDKRPGEGNNYNYGVFSVFKCSKCDQAWEYGLIGKKRVPLYHEEFPTYKLINKICPDCEVEDETD